MTAYVGRDGILKVGTTNVGEVRSFSVEETAETLETTAMGDSYRQYLTSFKNWTGTADVLWDADDNGQNAIVVGTVVSVGFYPEGEAVGDVSYTGSAIVTGLTINSSYDGLVEASVTLQGTGALTKA